MRVRPLVQLVMVPLLAVFVVGIAWGVVDVVVHRDIGYPFRTSHLGGVGVTLGWVVAAVIGLASLFTVLLLLRLRVAITPDGFDARGYFRHYRLRLDQVTGLVALSGSTFPTPQPKFPGLRVTARDADGRRRGFQLNAVYTGLDRAMPVFCQWVAARPQIVQDDVTRALFAAYGVPVAATERPVTPPAVGGPHTFVTRDGGSFTAGTPDARP